MRLAVTRGFLVPRPFRAACRRLSLALITGLVVGACGNAGPTPLSTSSTPASVAPTQSAPAGLPSSPASSATPSPSHAPSALGDGRLNVLLVGIDNTAEREASELTDSLIVASLDPVGGTVSLLGLPRDLTDFPLPGGMTYRQKLNSMYVEIQHNPERFGGSAGEEPLAILAKVVGNLVDLPIEHWAAIDMDGFADMVDALGGVDVYVKTGVCDSGYRQLGVRGFEASPGWWHLTGPQALAFGRVRHDAGGSDFQRMRRQQDLLVAVRDAVLARGAESDPLGWLARVPTIRNDLSPELIVAAAGVLAETPAERFHSRLIQPFGRGGTELYDDRGYVLRANLDEIHEAAGLLFTTPGKRPTTGRQQPPPDRPATVKALPRFNGC
jgi:LCP family protein required for cell wall assembly